MAYEEILLYNSKPFSEQYNSKLKANKSVISHILASSNSKMYNPATDDDDE